MVTATKILKNFVTLFSGNVIGQLFFFLGLAYLARVLGPSQFGLWNFSQVFMLYLTRGSEFGLETIAIQESSRQPQSLSRWIVTTVFIRATTGTILFGMACICVWAEILPEGTGLLVLISSLCVFPMALVLEWVFESRQEVRIISIARIFRGLCFAALVFLFVSSNQDSEIAAFIYVGSLAISVVPVAVIAIRRYGADWSALTVSNGIKTLMKAVPIGIASLLSQYSLFASTMVVAYFLSKEDLGYFTAANRIVLFLWAYVILSMHRVLLPNLSRSFHDSRERAREVVVRLFRLTVLAVVPLGLIGTLFSESIMNLLYSSQYASAGVVFGILIWGFVLANVRAVLEISLIASDTHGLYLRGMIFLAALYTLITPFLAFSFGIVGVAVAVLCSELGYLLFLVTTCPYLAPMSFLRELWKPFFAAVTPVALLISIGEIHSVMGVVLALGVFGLLLVATKAISSEDVGFLKGIVRLAKFEPSV
jgi:O-antigen/teichoic acid export membrane protein